MPIDLFLLVGCVVFLLLFLVILELTPPLICNHHYHHHYQCSIFSFSSGPQPPLDPQQFGEPRVESKHWASQIRVVDAKEGKTLQTVQLAQDEMLLRCAPRKEERVGAGDSHWGNV